VKRSHISVKKQVARPRGWPSQVAWVIERGVR